MESESLKKIADELIKKKDYAFVGFSAVDEFALADIQVEVESVGILDFPLGQEGIEKLLSISSDAHFGLGEKTVLDKNVRDTQVIAPDKLKITINEQSLLHVLTRMGNALGLAKSGSLIPYLHNMLIYGEGQFFDLHQDSEKLENMVATLVIVLPSPHIGGNLIIQHGWKLHTFSSEDNDLGSAKCVAFYSDCKHKVEKIKSGHRITLTYNLVLKSEELHLERVVNNNLKQAIQEYFAPTQDDQHKKLVYFLNHYYTEHGLKWNALKGEDLENSSDIYAVAMELDLIPHLGLVEICRTFDDEDGYYLSSDEEPEIYELSLSSVNFTHWLDAENKKLPYNNFHIYEDEICLTKATGSFQPFKEHDYYTGNEGGTSRYWYRRAAVILWRKTSHIPLNFLLNYNNAINDLYVLTTVPGNEAEVIRIVEKAGICLFINRARQMCHCRILLIVALYHKDPVKALGISKCLDWKDLNPDIAEALAKLQTQYGVSWCIDLLNVMKGKESRGIPILGKINILVKKFLGYGGKEDVMELVLNVQCCALIENILNRPHNWTATSEQNALSKKMERFYQILESCAAVQNVSVQSKVVQYLMENPDLYPETELAKLLLRLQKALPSDYFPHFHSFKDYVFKSIEKLVSSGIQSEDDWSIKTTLACKCEFCVEALQFLHSKTAINKQCVLTHFDLNHLYQRLNVLCLPVNMDVDRTGSPQKLILTKNEKLHDEAKKRYKKLKYWLKRLKASNRNDS